MGAFSAVIPCGSQPDVVSDDGSTVYDHYVNTFFRSAYAEAQQAPIESIIVSNSGYTGLDALSTDDTTSFTYADQSGYGAALPSGYGNNQYIRTAGRQDAPFALPADVINLTGQLIAVAKTSGSQNLYVAGNTVDSSGIDWFGTRVPSVEVPKSTDWTRHAVAIPGTMFPSEWRTQLALRNFRMYVTPAGGDDFDGVVSVAYLALALSWDVTEPEPTRRRIAHNRGVQRGSDGQGVTGGKRGLQRTSRQSSLRGGSFL